MSISSLNNSGQISNGLDIFGDDSPGNGLQFRDLTTYVDFTGVGGRAFFDFDSNNNPFSIALRLRIGDLLSTNKPVIEVRNTTLPARTLLVLTLVNPLRIVVFENIDSSTNRLNVAFNIPDEHTQKTLNFVITKASGARGQGAYKCFYEGEALPRTITDTSIALLTNPMGTSRLSRSIVSPFVGTIYNFATWEAELSEDEAKAISLRFNSIDYSNPNLKIVCNFNHQNGDVIIPDYQADAGLIVSLSSGFSTDLGVSNDWVDKSGAALQSQPFTFSFPYLEGGAFVGFRPLQDGTVGSYTLYENSAPGSVSSTNIQDVYWWVESNANAGTTSTFAAMISDFVLNPGTYTITFEKQSNAGARVRFLGSGSVTLSSPSSYTFSGGNGSAGSLTLENSDTEVTTSGSGTGVGYQFTCDVADGLTRMIIEFETVKTGAGARMGIGNIDITQN